MTTLPEPTVQPSTLIEPDGAWGSLYTLSQMRSFGRQCAKQERSRIMQIVSDVAQAYGKPGECMFITVRVRAEKELT